jgi:hypothetical protein
MMMRDGGGAFVHAHPDESNGSAVATVASSPPDGEVPFLVRLPSPGLYRGWAQFQQAGEVITFDFIVHGWAPK